MSSQQKKPKRIAQFLPSFEENDAVGRQVVMFSRYLKEAGIETNIYAQNIQESATSYVRNWYDFKAEIKDYDYLIYHHSIGSDCVDEVRILSTPMILYYHNITPPVFYSRYNKIVHENLLTGRAQLSSLAPKAVLGISASRFSEKELKSFGCKNTDVFPIIFDPEDIEAIKTDKKLAEELNKDKITNILFIGRFAPNKCHADIIKAFYFYSKYYNSISKLHLVGNMHDVEKYVDELESLVNDLELSSQVKFYDKVDSGKWRAFYENSHLFLAMTEHEGFFAPALEANYFNLPILAYAQEAVVDTVGNAGLITHTKSGEFVAESMNRLLSDQNLRETCVKNGQENYKKYLYEELKPKFNEIIDNL